MQHGLRESQWNHTAAIIKHVRLAMGDKQAKSVEYNPYVGQRDQRAKFKQITKESK